MRKFDTKVQHLKYRVLKEVARFSWEGTLKENLTVILQKNGFNLGNAELFKAFIQSRVPVTAKIKFK